MHFLQAFGGRECRYRRGKMPSSSRSIAGFLPYLHEIAAFGGCFVQNVSDRKDYAIF